MVRTKTAGKSWCVRLAHCDGSRSDPSWIEAASDKCLPFFPSLGYECILDPYQPHQSANGRLYLPYYVEEK
jgi:hypothetical protein